LQSLISFIFILPANPERISNLAGIVVEKQEIINSWQLYGHLHGKLPPIGKQWDIGVDNNNFYPVSFNKICEIMVDRPDDPNFVISNAA